jgi:hypothetical protein
MEDVGIFYGHLVYFKSIWYIYVMVIKYFFHFGMQHQEISINPGTDVMI